MLFTVLWFSFSLLGFCFVNSFPFLFVIQICLIFIRILFFIFVCFEFKFYIDHHYTHTKIIHHRFIHPTVIISTMTPASLSQTGIYRLFLCLLHSIQVERLSGKEDPVVSLPHPNLNPTNSSVFFSLMWYIYQYTCYIYIYATYICI